jgi:hypothetical protein
MDDRRRVTSIFEQFGAVGIELEKEDVPAIQSRFVLDMTLDDDFDESAMYYIYGSRYEIENMLKAFAPYDIKGFMRDAFVLKK